jgi:hypothetical protein
LTELAINACILRDKNVRKLNWEKLNGVIVDDFWFFIRFFQHDMYCSMTFGVSETISEVFDNIQHVVTLLVLRKVENYTIHQRKKTMTIVEVQNCSSFFQPVHTY